MEAKHPRQSIAPNEIFVRDGHLAIKLIQVDNGWHAVVESDYEGKIFEGRVTELSELLAGQGPCPEEQQDVDAD